MNTANPWLIMAGVGSFSVSILHIIVIFIGAPAYRYFGAGEKMATMSERGLWYPTLVTLGIVIVFFIFGMYALSGAQVVVQLPLIKPILVFITAIYLLRGAVFFVQLFDLMFRHEVQLRHTVFSFVALLIGVAYLIGTLKTWKELW